MNATAAISATTGRPIAAGDLWAEKRGAGPDVLLLADPTHSAPPARRTTRRATPSTDIRRRPDVVRPRRPLPPANPACCCACSPAAPPPSTTIHHHHAHRYGLHERNAVMTTSDTASCPAVTLPSSTPKGGANTASRSCCSTACRRTPRAGRP